MKNKLSLLFMLGTQFYSLGVGCSSAVDNPFNADVYLPFDEITDGIVIGGTYDGTFLEDSSATVESGIQGNGIHLSDTVMTIGNRRDSCFWLPDLCNEGFTLAVWMKLGDKAGDELYYISNGAHLTLSYGLALLLNYRRLKAWVKTSGSHLYVEDSDTTVLNEWIHVVITWNSHTNDTKLYINTVLKDTQNEITTRSSPLTSSTYNRYNFGAANKNFDITSQAYYGEAILDELLFWEEVKTEDFIHYLYDYYMSEPLDPFPVNSKNRCAVECMSDPRATCAKFQYNPITSECTIWYLERDYERFPNSDCNGNNLPGSAVSDKSVQDCEQQCDHYSGCLGIVFKQEDSLCWLKSSCEQGQLIGFQGVDAYIAQVNTGHDQRIMCVTSVSEENMWICNGD